jgi:hypothetical protein
MVDVSFGLLAAGEPFSAAAQLPLSFRELARGLASENIVHGSTASWLA